MPYIITDGTSYCHRTRSQAVELVTDIQQATRFRNERTAQNLLARATKKLRGFELVEIPSRRAEAKANSEEKANNQSEEKKDTMPITAEPISSAASSESSDASVKPPVNRQRRKRNTRPQTNTVKQAETPTSASSYAYEPAEKVAENTVQENTENAVTQTPETKSASAMTAAENATIEKVVSEDTATDTSSADTTTAAEGNGIIKSEEQSHDTAAKKRRRSHRNRRNHAQAGKSELPTDATGETVPDEEAADIQAITANEDTQTIAAVENDPSVTASADDQAIAVIDNGPSITASADGQTVAAIDNGPSVTANEKAQSSATSDDDQTTTVNDNAQRIVARDDSQIATVNDAPMVVASDDSQIATVNDDAQRIAASDNGQPTMANEKGPTAEVQEVHVQADTETAVKTIQEPAPQKSEKNEKPQYPTSFKRKKKLSAAWSIEAATSRVFDEDEQGNSSEDTPEATAQAEAAKAPTSTTSEASFAPRSPHTRSERHTRRTTDREKYSSAQQAASAQPEEATEPIRSQIQPEETTDHIRSQVQPEEPAEHKRSDAQPSAVVHRIPTKDTEEEKETGGVRIERMAYSHPRSRGANTQDRSSSSDRRSGYTHAEDHRSENTGLAAMSAEEKQSYGSHSENTHSDRSNYDHAETGNRRVRNSRTSPTRLSSGGRKQRSTRDTGQDVGSTTASRRRLFTQQERNLIYNRSEGHCGICGRFIPLEEYTIDHIIPLSKGGTNDLDNLQACCSFCNKAKDDSQGDEFFTRIQRIYLYQAEQRYPRKQFKKLKKVIKELSEEDDDD